MERQCHLNAFELQPIPNIEPGRLLLHVPKSTIDIPFSVSSYADRYSFKAKDEYHVTVISKKTQEVLDTGGVMDDVVELLHTVPHWNLVSRGDVLLLRNVETNNEGNPITEESIIQLVTILELEAVYESIRSMTNLDIITPPPHITLFTKNADRGIGVYSIAQLSEYTVEKLK